MGNGKVDALKKIAMVALFVAGLVFLLSGGDEDNQRRAEAGHAKTVAKKESVQPQALYEVAPDGTFDIKEEVYGDPDIFDSPRIQFVFSDMSKSDCDSVWSVKTDGTDLRRVLSNTQLSPEGDAIIADIPRRSIDNRYICMTLNDNPNGFHKVVFDLKTGQKDVITRHGQSRNMGWQNDSRTIVFFGGGGVTLKNDRLTKLYKYDIKTKNITPYDWSNNIYFSIDSFFIHSPTNRIIVRGYERSIPLNHGGLKKRPENLVETYGVCIFNPDWSKHRMLITDGGYSFDVSPDGEYVIRGNFSDYFTVYSTKTGDVISKFESDRYIAIFSEDSYHIYVPSYDGFEKKSISDGKVVLDAKLPIDCKSLTLINI
ncbi:hypothetical protein [Desulfoluna spongiiphila]|uniref:WD40-like Beta Propeller Repeat n=1 Tax=Desulfoluna spongiiphila TaxID=419481 RepID=A0A1G5HPU2_9BACT|nr:hypothetical protein [Desulfoluna spongiiphila]SCY65882.1 hypothetical protein SAMN05216233_11557 [Desulfoluna spongiiphila]